TVDYPTQRWVFSTRVSVHPDSGDAFTPFAPGVDRSGVAICNSLLRTACEQAGASLDVGVPVTTVGVNVSGVELCLDARFGIEPVRDIGENRAVLQFGFVLPSV